MLLADDEQFVKSNKTFLILSSSSKWQTREELESIIPLIQVQTSWQSRIMGWIGVGICILCVGWTREWDTSYSNLQIIFSVMLIFLSRIHGAPTHTLRHHKYIRYLCSRSAMRTHRHLNRQEKNHYDRQIQEVTVSHGNKRTFTRRKRHKQQANVQLISEWFHDLTSAFHSNVFIESHKRSYSRWRSIKLCYIK